MGSPAPACPVAPLPPQLYFRLPAFPRPAVRIVSSRDMSWLEQQGPHYPGPVWGPPPASLAPGSSGWGPPAVSLAPGPPVWGPPSLGLAPGYVVPQAWWSSSSRVWQQQIGQQGGPVSHAGLAQSLKSRTVVGGFSAAKLKIRPRNLKIRLLSDHIPTKNQTKSGPELVIFKVKIRLVLKT